jgi:uncharacterized protein YjbI with pentapeptide repeats
MNYSRLHSIALIATFTLLINAFMPQAIAVDKSATPKTCANLSGRELSAFIRENLKANGQLTGCRLGVLAIPAKSKQNYSGIDLSKSTLQQTVLSRCNFTNANFTSANGSITEILRPFNASGSNFTKSNFSHAKMEYANFGGANFNQASFKKARFRGAYMVGADFTGADFTGADFTGAIFNNAKGTGIKGKPAKLPVGVRIVGGKLTFK